MYNHPDFATFTVRCALDEEATMKERGKLSTWWYWELAAEERKWGKHAMQAEEIRFEMQRRQDNWKMWSMWVALPAAIIALIGSVIHFFR
jgi:hypothetical protein